MSKILFMKKHDYQTAEMEIFNLLRNHTGSISGISGYMKENDSSRFSRQVSPTDERRDNPFIEVLKIQQAAMKFCPELEEQLWIILDRERSKHRQDTQSLEDQLNDLVEKIYDEFGDILKLKMRGKASKAEFRKEGFELLNAVKNFCEKVKDAEDE